MTDTIHGMASFLLILLSHQNWYLVLFRSERFWHNKGLHFWHRTQASPYILWEALHWSKKLSPKTAQKKANVDSCCSFEGNNFQPYLANSKNYNAVNVHVRCSSFFKVNFVIWYCRDICFFYYSEAILGNY